MDNEHVPGQMDIDDCIRVAAHNLDGKGAAPGTGARTAKADSDDTRPESAPVGRSAMTPAEVVRAILRGQP
jgi:hypothetical protein